MMSRSRVQLRSVKTHAGLDSNRHCPCVACIRATRIVRDPCEYRNLLWLRCSIAKARRSCNILGDRVQFLQVPDEMARYKQLLFLAAKLPPLPPQYQTSANQVQGCVSKVRALT